MSSNLSLASGTRLGPYEIVEPLSAGGMGELFRARDTRLGRDVAIKVPFAATASDRATRQRFQREARAIATLNHPHICTVHDVGSDSGVDYLVLELLEGESLSTRLKRGALPVDEALARAIEIADALAHAHKEGIVHRDLKPGNVMLTPSGAKVLDFGIARITRGDIDATISAAATATEPVSDPGAILGTIQYMAPEQLEGRVADARSDIYAFGATLFEMLAGKRAFEASSAPGVIASVLRGERPSLLAMRPDLPPSLDRLLSKCLAKDPEARFESLHDAAVALQWARDDIRGSMAVVAVDPHRPSSSRPTMAIGAAVAVSLVVIGVASWTIAGWRHTDAPTVRFSIQTPPMTNPVGFALSPDGQKIAFTAAPSGATNMLFLRSVGALDAQMLAGTEGAFAPFWSHDGQQIGFASQMDGKLKIVSVAGGASKVVCDITGKSEPMSFNGGSWSQDNLILYSTLAQLHRPPELGTGWLVHRVPATGGVPIPVGAIDRAAGETGHRWPYFLPDGRRFLYLSWSDEPTKRAVFVGSLDSSERTRVMSAESMATFVPPGYLLFTRQQRLFAQRFDSSTIRLEGEPMAIADGPLIVGTQGARAAFSASSQALVYRTTATGEGLTGEYSLAWIDRDGTVNATLRDTFNVPNIRLAPDAKRVAFVDRGTNTSEDLWIYDIDLNQRISFAVTPASDRWPLWSPDGLRVAFARRPGNDVYLTYEQRVDRALPAKPLLSPESGFEYGPLDWTAQYVIFQRQKTAGASPNPGDSTGFEVWAQSMSGNPRAFPYLTGLSSATHAALSPNGRWLAYVDRQGDTHDLIVRSFPDESKSRHVISTSGVCPRWRRDGKELYFLGLDGGLTAVSVSSEAAFAVDKSERLFTVPLRNWDARYSSGPACPYDARSDGQRFIVALPGGGANRFAPINVVLNWMAELRP